MCITLHLQNTFPCQTYSTVVCKLITLYWKNCSILSLYTGSYPRIYFFQGGLWKYNKCLLFADGRTNQLQSTWGENRCHKWSYVSSFVSWGNHWSHDLRWNSIRRNRPMQCKMFIILINMCEEFSYFILTQNILL
jgi:hypothetical protein